MDNPVKLAKDHYEERIMNYIMHAHKNIIKERYNITQRGTSWLNAYDIYEVPI